MSTAPAVSAPWKVLAATLFVIALAACGDASTADDRVARMTTEAQTRLGATDAGQTVLRAIDAAGGLEAWYGVPTSAYAWEYANVGSNIQFKSYLVADNYSRRIYHDLLTVGDYGDPQDVEGRFAWDGTNAWMWPAEIDRVNARFWAPTGFYFSSIPFVLADPGVVLESLPDAELDGEMYDMVRAGFEDEIGDAADNYTLYVDKETGQLRAIRYTVTFGGRPARGESLFYYNSYTTVDGLTVPTHFQGFAFVDGQKGDFRNEAWVTDISFRQPFDESKLTMPEGGKIQPLPGG